MALLGAPAAGGPLLARTAGVASRLDLLLTTGPRAALAHRRTAIRHARMQTGAIAAVDERIWRGAAAHAGAEVSEAGGGILELRRAGRATRVLGHITELEDPVTLRLSLDRQAVHGLLAGAGVPVPANGTYGAADLRRAGRKLVSAGDAVVVKPASGTGGGHGITCSVRSPSDLARAAVCAMRFGSRFTLERQVDGSMYRLLFLHGELLDVVRRDPPHVVGDGSTTVAGLILAENRRRVAAGGDLGVTLIRPDLDAVLTLRAAGLTLGSIPAPGRRLRVKTSSSENGPHENVTVRDALHAAVLRDARAAVGALGMRLAGVDLVTPDLGRDMREAGGAIVEVNATPGLRYHYQVADPGSATPVAVPILEHLLRDGPRKSDDRRER